jgi:hypothetical protein
MHAVDLLDRNEITREEAAGGGASLVEEYDQNAGVLHHSNRENDIICQPTEGLLKTEGDEEYPGHAPKSNHR